jgi:hypothetical protein
MDSILLLTRVIFAMHEDVKKRIKSPYYDESLEKADQGNSWFRDCLNNTPLGDALPAKTKREAYAVECAMNDHEVSLPSG